MGPTGKPTGSPTAQLQAFAQSVYKMIKNRYYDDLTSADGQSFLAGIVDWANEFIDELETEVTPDGNAIDWIWVRQPGVTLGVATAGADSISWDPAAYNNLCAGGERFVQILDPANGSNVLANFTVVAPDEMSNDSNRNPIDMCTLVNNNIEFSRNFSTQEVGGTIVGDVTNYIPRLTTTLSASTGLIVATNVDALSIVRPLQLLKLGTVKNAILPDIVMGGLNPSYTQKYNDLLGNAISRSMASAISPTADYDDFTGVRGVY
jgi:hypothetical protein